MRQLDHKKELIVLGIGMLILIILLVGVYNQVQNLNRAREDLEVKETALALSESTLSSLEELADQGVELEQQLDYLSYLLPPTAEESRLINIMLDVTPAGGKISDINFGDYLDHDGYTEVSLDITFRGRYRGLIELLNNLDQNARVFRVDDISIYEGEEGFPSIQAELSINTFYSDEAIIEE